MRAVAVICVLLFGAHVHAQQPESIVLASGDPAFQAALADALAPAGMAVVTVKEAPPSAIDISNSSRVIADREHASSTVWLLADANGSTLITYDRGVDRVLVRSLPYIAPLDPAQAAEVARMARTMLHALRVTPDVDLPPPHAVDAAAVRARAASEPRIAAPDVIRSPKATLAVDASFGVRLGAPAADAGIGGTFAATWLPDRLGVTLRVGLAPSAAIHATTFMGTISDDSITLAARLPLRVADHMVAIGTAGPSLHIVQLDGELTGGGSATAPRFNPAAQIGLTLQYELGAFEVGVGVSADWLLRRQKYDVGADEIVGMSPIQLSAGLVVMARIL
ncbi:MAG: hypothetical protein JWO36_4497 [Myxococcales bacterium]|nr:hypothetical protein [Myxococcales bacterium]